MLIVRVGAMGDILHALPAVAALRKAQPEWTVDWAIDERWAPLLESGSSKPVAGTVYPLPVRAWKRFPLAGALPRSLLKLYYLRRLRYDVVVDMQGTLRSAAIGRLAGANRLVGYADPREAPAKLFYHRAFPRQGLHVVEQGAALLSAASGVQLRPAFSELPVNEEAERWAEALLTTLGRPSRLAVLAPAAGWGAKEWPAARFGELAVALSREGWSVLVNSPPGRADGEDTAAMKVLAATGERARPVTCSVAEFTSLLRRAALLVGGDSGPTHLAATLGVPLVALFGPTDPGRNGPWGPGPKRVLRNAASVTSYRHVPTPDSGLLAIGVEEVLAAIRSL